MMRRRDYVFALGKIRAKEVRLLRQEDFQRMLEAPNLEEALKVLVEAGEYPQKVLAIKNSDELEALLKEKKEQLYSLIKDLLEDEEPIEPLFHLKVPQEAFILARESKNFFLLNYIRKFIDLMNIKNFLRLRNLKAKKEDLQNLLLDCGSIDKRVFLEIFEEPISFFINKFSHTDYAKLVKESTLSWQEEGSFLKLEKMIEDFLMERLELTKYLAFGYKPLLAYLLAKEAEFRLVRLVIISRLNSLSKEKALNRLSKSFR